MTDQGIPMRYNYAKLTTERLKKIIASDRKIVILLPVGAVEPHGPHLSLLTDVFISTAAAACAAKKLEKKGVFTYIAPPISYTVANCGAAFSGGISVSASTMRLYLKEIVEGFLGHGVDHVCIINSHLEPEHEETLRALAAEFQASNFSLASPLSRRWAKTLTEEFKKGACHAGQYETSLMLAAAPEFVDIEITGGLPEVDVSLSEKLKEGVTDFKKMGLERSYAGSPARASAGEGEETLEKLGEMVKTVVLEAMKNES